MTYHPEAGPPCPLCFTTLFRPGSADPTGACVDKEWCLKRRTELAAGGP